jgi:hypothetical protein
MPPNELILHQVLRGSGHGGVYNYANDPDHSHRALFNLFVNETLQLAPDFRASGLCIKPFPDLLAGIAACDELNAGAFKGNDVYFISLCRGSIDLLIEMFRRLVCMPAVFPWLGGLSPEAPPPTFPPFPRTSSFIARDYFAHPIERRRFAASAWMLGIALKFLRLHEFRHIISGHVDYYIQYFNATGINELVASSPASSSDNQIKQALEIEADCASVVLLLALYFSPTPLTTCDLEFLAECDDKHEKVFVLLLTSVLAVIKLLGDEMPAYGRWDDYDHPPNVVRAGLLPIFWST